MTHFFWNVCYTWKPIIPLNSLILALERTVFPRASTNFCVLARRWLMAQGVHTEPHLFVWFKAQCSHWVFLTFVYLTLPHGKYFAECWSSSLIIRYWTNQAADHSVSVKAVGFFFSLTYLFRSLVLWSAEQSRKRPKNLQAVCRYVCIILLFLFQPHYHGNTLCCFGLFTVLHISAQPCLVLTVIYLSMSLI